MVDVAAPGGNLATDVNGDGYADGVLSPHADDSSGAPQFEYLFLAGTSMAAPHVAGVAALMKSANANLTPALFDQLLVQGDLTDDIGTPGRDNFFGYGLIDAQKAVSAALTAAGSPPPDNPELTANPLSLNFGSSMTSLQLNVTNSGTGSLQVTSVTTDRPWLQAVAQAVDGDGLGTYAVTVDRGALADGVYTGTILLASNVNTVQVPVIMNVGNNMIGGNVGHIYIALVDPVTGSTVSGTEVDFIGGNYAYQVVDVPAGEYLVIAGTDSDNDGFICDDGEVCGEYLTRDQPITIEVTTDLTGLDFLVNYEVPVNPLAGPANGKRKGIRRQPDTIKFVD
jgi:serine protease